jgi:hypothetical protein
MYKPGFILPIPAWGGGDITTNQGLGAQAGYTYLLGGVPIPYAGIRIGGKRGGVSVNGPFPMLGLDTGKRTGHWESAAPRSLWKMLHDKLAEVKARKSRRSIKIAAPVRMGSVQAALAQRLMRDPSQSAYLMQNLAKHPSGDPQTDDIMKKIMQAIKRKQTLARTLGMGG